jgi:hypothetical protein
LSLFFPIKDLVLTVPDQGSGWADEWSRMALDELTREFLIESQEGLDRMERRRKALFAGAYRLQDSLLVMLDPERLDPMRLGKTKAAYADFAWRRSCEH